MTPSEPDSNPGSPQRDQRDVSDAATRVLPREAPDGATASGTMPTVSLAAMDQSLARHSYPLTGVVFVIATSALLGIGLLDTSATARWLMGASALLAVIGGALMGLAAKDHVRFGPARALPGLCVTALAISLGVTAYGVFSPGPIVTVIFVLFVAQSNAPLASSSALFVSVGMHMAWVALFLAGVVQDPGVVQAQGLSVADAVVLQCVVVVVVVAAFVVGRVWRSATFRTHVLLDEAVRIAARREALFLEAKADLEVALALGDAGRYTDQTLAGYKLGNVIARGGMGEIYEAVHTGTGQLGAAKLLRRETMAEPQVLARFLREARLLSELQMPNIVRILETSDAGAPIPFMIMELLRGQDLGALLRERQRLPPGELNDLLLQVGRGVDAAHAQGIIHRDLKPQNLFQHRLKPGDHGTWKVLDFGVGRRVTDGATLTADHIVGTPAYMSPEQITGQEVDGRTDVYALGVIAFRTLTGELPFRGGDLGDLLYAVAHAPVPSASRLAVDLPGTVDGVLQIALAKRPADRFRTAGEFTSALAEALASGAPVARRRAAQGGDPLGMTRRGRGL